MIETKDIRGIVVPIVTALHEDETINEPALRAHIERMLAAGVHGIFPFGTNGEGYILSPAEKEQVLAICIDQVAGRVPVYAGTGCISTKETVALSQRAEAMGASILSIITPSFAVASQDEMYWHYRTIAESVHTPILLYNIPARTGNSLAPATIGRLSEVDNIVGVKDSSGNFDNMLQYMDAVRGKDFAVLSGNDSLILWGLLAGSSGAIAGCANVFPEHMVSIYEHFKAGDIAAARKAQDAIRPFRDCFKLGNPNSLVKAAVRMLGHDVGPCRAPFNRITPEAEKALRTVLDQLQTEGVIV